MAKQFETKEECLNAVKRDYRNLKYCTIKDEEVCMTAWRKDRNAILYFPDEFKTEELQREYVKEERRYCGCDACDFTFMDEDMAYVIVKNDRCTSWNHPGYSLPKLVAILERFPDAVTQKVAEAAVKATPWAAYMVPDKLSQEFINEWAKTDWSGDGKTEANTPIFQRVTDDAVLREVLVESKWKIRCLAPEKFHLAMEFYKKDVSNFQYYVASREALDFLFEYVKQNGVTEELRQACDRIKLGIGKFFSTAELQQRKDTLMQILDQCYQYYLRFSMSKFAKEEPELIVFFKQNLGFFFELCKKNKKWIPLVEALIELVPDSTILEYISEVPAIVKFLSTECYSEVLFFYLADKGYPDLTELEPYRTDYNGNKFVSNKIAPYLSERVIIKAIEKGGFRLKHLELEQITPAIFGACIQFGLHHPDKDVNKDSLKKLLKQYAFTEEQIVQLFSNSNLDVSVIKKLPEEFQKLPALYASVRLKEGGWFSFSDIPEDLRSDVALLTYKQFPEDMHYVDQLTPEIVTYCVNKVPSLIGQVPSHLRTYDLCKLAFSGDKTTIQYFPEHDDLLLEACKSGVIGNKDYFIDDTNQHLVELTLHSSEHAVACIEAVGYKAAKVIPKELQTPEIHVTLMQSAYKEWLTKYKDNYTFRNWLCSYRLEVFTPSKEYEDVLCSITLDNEDEILQRLKALGKPNINTLSGDEIEDLIDRNPEIVLDFTEYSDKTKCYFAEAIENKNTELFSKVLKKFPDSYELCEHVSSPLICCLNDEQKAIILEKDKQLAIEELCTLSDKCGMFNLSSGFAKKNCKMIGNTLIIKGDMNPTILDSTNNYENKDRYRYMSLGYANYNATIDYFDFDNVGREFLLSRSYEFSNVALFHYDSDKSIFSTVPEYNYLVQRDVLAHCVNGLKSYLPVVTFSLFPAVIIDEGIAVSLDRSCEGLKEIIEKELLGKGKSNMNLF